MTEDEQIGAAIQSADRLYGIICGNFSPHVAAHAFCVVLGYQGASQKDPSAAVTQMAGVMRETCDKRRREMRADKMKVVPNDADSQPN